MYTLTMTRREVEILRAACLKLADDFDLYARWVDDRPMLPAREVALERIKAEAKAYRELALRTYDMPLYKMPGETQ